MVRKVRFHPTIDTLVAVLGSPGPVVTVLRSLGPVMITDSLMVKETSQKSNAIITIILIFIGCQ